VEDNLVRDVTVRSVVVPLRRPLATKVGDFSRWPLLLIDVTTEQGLTARGWLGLAGYQGLALAAVAGLDIALWDVLAQAAGLPLAVLLGGTLAPVPARPRRRSLGTP
jgi:mandelate racemase